jgi:hypothetical protein
MISRTAEASGLTSMRAQALKCLMIPSAAISTASPLILKTGEPVYGRFAGLDPAMSLV